MKRKNKKWTKDEDKKLLSLYGKEPVSKIIKEIPDRSTQAIISRSSKIFRLKSISKLKWTKDQLHKLKLLYPQGNKDDLVKTFKVKWHTIKNYAAQNNIHRLPKYNLSKLLREDLNAYYWIGFLLADGCFYKRRINKLYDCFSLSLQLSSKDSCHMKKFVRFMNYEGKTNIRKNNGQLTINMNSGNLIPKIMKKFNIYLRKTYNPPPVSTFTSLSPNKYFSLIIGYIDGDGNIQKQKNKYFKIRIENHKKWDKFDKNAENFLFNLFEEKHNKDSIKYRKNRNTCYIIISKGNLIKKIKNKVKELNLPYMERKWDKIK